MNKNKAIEILENLETLRDRSLSLWSRDVLVENFFLSNLNIFTSTFFFATTEIVEKTESLEQVYLAYFRSRNTPLRFLFEQYLTVIHIAAQAPENRLACVYKYQLSGKLRIHQIDLRLSTIITEQILGDQKKLIEQKLEINRQGYRSFLERRGRLLITIPNNIDDFFEGSELINTKVRFGVALYKGGKINFMDEIQQNPLIPELVKDFLLVFYPLLSMDIHPTHNSVVDFEQFIGKNENQKGELSIARHSALTGQLCMVGEAMLQVWKDLLEEEI